MEIVNLNNLIKNLDIYRAHSKCLDENAENKEYVYETLQEHTDRTSKYFKKFWQTKKCDDVFEKFCNSIWINVDDKDKAYVKKILKEMIFAVPVFHDTGKINPVFQKDAMNNKTVTGLEDFGSRNHAMISAIIYIDYFRYNVIGKIKDRTLRDLLKPFILYNAYVISRHHSDLCDFNTFIGKLEAEREKIIIAINKNEICTEKLKWRESTIKKMMENVETNRKDFSIEQSLYLYIYDRLLYSLLVASDYYATGEFENGAEFKQDGDIDDINKWINIYENTPLMQGIREYQQKIFPQTEKDLQHVNDINILRSEIFCEAETVLKQEYTNNIFYLEAPTGSGKSNTAINLSFQLMKTDKNLSKIFYVYPFNTLVEQNLETLEKIFGKNTDIIHDIAVLNSLTPIKMNKQTENEDKVYQQALFDRQFLNYPMVLTTHVNLFDIFFNNNQKSVFGFYQMINSVIVLDEIQSYKNTLWAMIITYLKAMAKLFNMKIIIMSATLPDLDKISHQQQAATVLLKNAHKYFNNNIFKNRVEISYEILDKADLKNEQLENFIKEHLKQQLHDDRHIMIEFIKKSTAYRFWEKLKDDDDINCDIEFISGDDSMAERNRILNKIKSSKKTLILVATQVIEAGVDIDMDLGYKDISKLDSEEQFLGRINRSCRKSGKVYFFNLDNAKSIYKEDVRNNTELTLLDETIRKNLKEKDFSAYYDKILAILKRNYKSEYNEFLNNTKKLKWEDIAKQMRLIDDDEWNMTVYLARKIEDACGNIVDGAEIWEKYKELLQNYAMEYAEKRIKLSQVTAQMTEFMYQVKKVVLSSYSEKIGSITYIKDGEKYFDAGKLNRARLQGEVSDFVDFI